MIKQFIYNLLKRRHFWRYASFSEIAELYMSRVLRIVGVNIAAGFASVYLYQIGYSLITITLMFAFYYLFKVLVLRWAAHYTAYFGPKHGILISNILYIPAMLALGFVEDFGLIAILVWLISLAFSTSIYGLSYNVDFSKVKSLAHAGKEIGFMNIFEKLAIGVSPIVGGVIALLFGPQTVMLVGALVFVFSAIPLFRTAEQTRVRQKLDFVSFPWKMAIRSLISSAGLGVDYVSTFYAWSLFIAIVIFSNSGNEIYVLLGALSSVSLLVAIFISYAFGKLIDKGRGGELLRYSVILNSLVHASRAIAFNPPAVVTTNLANEISTSGMNMAYLRGMFDTADLSGHRIIYVSLVEMASNLGASLACLALVACVLLFGEADGLKAFFLVAAVATLSIGSARFRLYSK